MTALPPAADVIRVEHDFVIGTDATAGVRLFFRYSGGPPDSADCVSIATAAMALAVTHLVPLFDTDGAINSITVTDLNSDTGAQGIYAVQHTGTRTGVFLPSGVAVVSAYQIARRYRGGKPRSYWPFGTDTDLANASLFASASVTEFQDGISAYIAGVSGITEGTTVVGPHLNVSYYGPPNVIVTNPVTGRARTVSTKRVTPLQDVILTQTVDQIPGSQRRRYQRR